MGRSRARVRARTEKAGKSRVDWTATIVGRWPFDHRMDILRFGGRGRRSVLDITSLRESSLKYGRCFVEMGIDYLIKGLRSF